ncbi:hypothetical protein T265_05000 [Opisthorchis viverrini]|uniref:GP-PDE domain-containing protein n=1 Tax=Opisthorchis viverrini TaxID=6198 RepID=A0A075AFU4_OPIVI|nr:hypothetical protein T265_05000 [Opisthorchis viverrini]KER28089.1 hypothetical protein T265_05000 [Opisthorchis viverrini]
MGPDGLYPALSKEGVESKVTNNKLTKLINAMWYEEVPAEWGMSTVLRIFKKDMRMLCVDHSGISLVSNLINEYQRQKRTVWGAMDRKVAAKCRRTNPEVLMYPPLAHGLGYILAYHIGLLPFLPIPYDCFEFPLMQAIKDKRPMHWQANNTWKTRAVVHLLCFLMSFPGMYEHIKRRGIPVFMWVGNTYSEFRTAFELGATGVMTDYPSRLRAFLDGDTKMADRTTSS